MGSCKELTRKWLISYYIAGFQCPACTYNHTQLQHKHTRVIKHMQCVNNFFRQCNSSGLSGELHNQGTAAHAVGHRQHVEQLGHVSTCTATINGYQRKRKDSYMEQHPKVNQPEHHNLACWQMRIFSKLWVYIVIIFVVTRCICSSLYFSQYRQVPAALAIHTLWNACWSLLFI